MLRARRGWLLLLPLLLPLAFVPAVFVSAWVRSERTFRVERLHPARPADLPGLEDVHLHTADGLELFAWFLPPRSGATILLLHGSGQGRGQMLFEARSLAAAGYGVLIPDFRGHGESQGEITWGDRERLDVRAALDFLRRDPRVDASRLGALGFSLGAIALPDAALDAPGLRAIVLVSPFPTLRRTVGFDFGKWGALSTSGALVPYLRRGLDVNMSPARAISRLPIPLLVIEGGKEHLPWRPGELEADLPAGSELWVVPGADHGDVPEVAPQAYAARLRAYFDRRLAVSAAP
jgi:dipeptidyl aminopeptidase/acylaminoacyl peptidase